MVLPLAHLAVLIALGAEPRPLPKVIADLGSPEFEVREAASAELLKAGEGYTLTELEKALGGAGLSPEQRVRLDDAAFRAFENSPRAAMGVRFGNGADFEIGEVIPNFPAAGVLKPRDIIAEIDGQKVSSRLNPDGTWSTVRSIVFSHDPDDKVQMKVLRDGATVTLSLTLGSYQALSAGVRNTAPDPVELRAAWAVRQNRNAGAGRAGGGTIDATSLRTRGVPFEDGRPKDVVDESNEFRAQNGESPSVVAGAAPDRSRQTERFEAQASGLQRFNNGGGWAAGGGGNFRFAALDARELARMTDADLTAERLRLFQQAQVYMMFAEQRGAGGGRGLQARQFNELLNQTQQQLDAVTAEINKRKAARQDEKQPKPAIAPDDQKPDQKADKP